MQQRSMKVALFLTLLTLGPMTVWAENQQTESHGLVTRMLTACEDQQEGAIVTLTLRQGKAVESICQKYGGELLAVPTQLLKKLRRRKSRPN